MSFPLQIQKLVSGASHIQPWRLPRATFLPATRYAVASVERRQKTSDEIQRDQLLGEYQTGPAMSRLRALELRVGVFG